MSKKADSYSHGINLTFACVGIFEGLTLLLPPCKVKEMRLGGNRPFVMDAFFHFLKDPSQSTHVILT